MLRRIAVIGENEGLYGRWRRLPKGLTRTWCRWHRGGAFAAGIRWGWWVGTGEDDADAVFKTALSLAGRYEELIGLLADCH